MSENRDLDKEYAKRRKDKSHSFHFRLERRTLEVIMSIEKYFLGKPIKILDIGAADGLMLGEIKKRFPDSECVGVDNSKELIAANKDQNIKIIEGDAENLPFSENSFDVVVAAAIIEHLDNPEKMLEEARRVLKRGGIFIVTSPNPFFDKLGRVAGWLKRDRFLKGEKHNIMFNLKKLKEYFKKADFEIVYAGRFMFSHMKAPGGMKIEKFLKIIRFDFIFLNQVIVGKK